MRRVLWVGVLVLAVLGVAPRAVGQAEDGCPAGTTREPADGSCRCSSTDSEWFARPVLTPEEVAGCQANLALCDPTGAHDPCLPGPDIDYDGDGDIDADDQAVLDELLTGGEDQHERVTSTSPGVTQPSPDSPAAGQPVVAGTPTATG